jgi:hypothetical protein
LVAMVAVMTLSILGVLGAVGSAWPDTADAKERTLTVLTTEAREVKPVDRKPKGPSHGDMRILNAPLYNESATKKMGRLDLFCVITDPADEPNEKAHMTECAITHTLPGGEIDVQSVNAYPQAPRVPI